MGARNSPSGSPIARSQSPATAEARITTVGFRVRAAQRRRLMMTVTWSTSDATLGEELFHVGIGQP